MTLVKVLTTCDNDNDVHDVDGDDNGENDGDGDDDGDH